jgi:tetratricopeptide (TPR) repeat protein
MTKPLNPEDYAEPRCLLGDERWGASPAVIPVPQGRIIEKLDEYLARRDYESAERHLLYWLEEARQGRDDRGRLLICNELVGHYRKNGKKDEAFRFAEEALGLAEALGYAGSVTGGATRVNAATAYSAFGESEKALALFRLAREDFAADPHTRPELLGGLYNNMALACKDLGRYDEAFSLFDQALETMGRIPGGKPEQAVTCLNMADTLAQQLGPEAAMPRIRELLGRAMALLRDGEAPRDGYYAFVCEKCAPGFADYGMGAEAEELRRTAGEIYGRA